VCVPLDDAADKLPAELRTPIELWLQERGLRATTISAGAGDRTYPSPEARKYEVSSGAAGRGAPAVVDGAPRPGGVRLDRDQGDLARGPRHAFRSDRS